MKKPNIKKDIIENFGNRLRTRVNGILIQDNKLLMVKHRMHTNHSFWNVPGGGMKFGQDAKENLKREFLEETGLNIAVNDYLFVHEFLEPPLHAIELFFEVSQTSGKLVVGIDPELETNKQVIEEVKFLSIEEIKKIPSEKKHALFGRINSLNDVRIWKGYFNFGNKCIK
ncbi:NUDIX domain-containing protein [Cyclobacterium amurskyense]|uniref:NUDIX hydrolase n=1 Tax=Cyclobacterium amurskyense TaxID=320787 RepID=A0A0H4PBX2_9BACT|nr:NUDIX hydrolase [Cyclobacterium amurskyense]AKP50308.1 NUDIX hydrolase [Cyclobacterium amurskyense]|tara:strand:- start:23099 stop:23608 length:510 start_codon:yes stop_codon:yes gene_type:complete